MKNIRVKFEDSGKIAFIIGGLIILLFMSAIIVFIVLPENNPDLLKELASKNFIFVLLAIAMILKPFFPSKEGLTQMEIKESNLYMTIYDNQKNKNDIEIPISEINSFSVNIKHDFDYDMDMICNSPVITAIYAVITKDNCEKDKNDKDFLVELVINCKNEKFYNIYYVINDLNRIKQLFSIAKFLPNFSYKVIANLDMIEARINNYAKFGKELNIVQYFKVLFADKHIKDDQKIVYKILLSFILILLFIALLMIVSIIKDTLLWF